MSDRAQQATGEQPFSVRKCAGWCLEVTFASDPPGSMATHLVCNFGDNERHARQIMESCNRAAQQATGERLPEWHEGYLEGLREGSENTLRNIIATNAERKAAQQPTDGALREALRKHVEFLREREEASSLDYYADELEAILGHALAAQPKQQVTDGALREKLHQAIGDCCFKDGTIASWIMAPFEVEEHLYEKLRALAAQASSDPLDKPSERGL